MNSKRKSKFGIIGRPWRHDRTYVGRFVVPSETVARCVKHFGLFCCAVLKRKEGLRRNIRLLVCKGPANCRPATVTSRKKKNPCLCSRLMKDRIAKEPCQLSEFPAIC